MSRAQIAQQLLAIGFDDSYIHRAITVYEKNYGHTYNIEVITEIIIRLQSNDQAKSGKEFEGLVDTLKWEWRNYYHLRKDSFYGCISYALFGDDSQESQQKVRTAVFHHVSQTMADSAHLATLFYDRDRLFAHGCKASPSMYTNICNLGHGVCNVDIMAVSELYNVRIILFARDAHSVDNTIVLDKFKCYWNEDNVDRSMPLIILGRMGRPRLPRFGLISDVHDVSSMMDPPLTLQEYKTVIDRQRPKKDIVRNVCSYYCRQWDKKRCIPLVLQRLIVYYMPKLNVAPIGLPEDRMKEYTPWNVQELERRRKAVIELITEYE